MAIFDSTVSITTLLTDDYDKASLRLSCANDMLNTLVATLSTSSPDGVSLNAHQLANALHGVTLLLDGADEALGKYLDMAKVAA